MKMPSFLDPSQKKGRITLISVTVLLYIIIIKILPIDFQDNDDYVYSRILSGDYSGMPSPLTVYEGYLFGVFVSGLYRLFPNCMEWYILVFHMLYILSFIVIGKKILQSQSQTNVRIITFSVASIIQLYLLLSPQFTILAGELSLAAAVCLIGQSSKREYLIAVILIFLSSQLRVQALLMVFVPMMPLLFLPLEIKKIPYWTKVGVVFLSIGLSVGIHKICNEVYYQDADWKYYSEYNLPRGIIEQNYCKIQAADLISDPIKKTEYINLCNFKLIDGKILSIEEMNECADFLKSKTFLFFKMNVLPYFYGLNAHCFLLLVLWLTGLFIYSIRKRNWTITAIILFTTIFFIVELLYCMTTSWVKERLVLCFIMYLFVVAAVCTNRLLRGRALRKCVIPIAIIIACTYLIKSYRWEQVVNEHLRSSEKVNALLESIPYEKVHVIGITAYAESYHIQSTPFTQKVIGKGWLNNIPLHSIYYDGYESLLDRIPIVLNPEYLPNIDDIERALSAKGISCTRKYLKKDNDCIVVMLTRNK